MRTTRRRRARGFTLVEILVALSAGVLVSMAAFALSRNATAFFQHEARISTAQLAVTLGLNRITADLSRASYLSSPNAKSDPMVCRDATWASAGGLNSLAGVQIRHGTTLATSQAGINGLNPDELIVGGSLDNSEVFTVQCVINGNGGLPALQLQDPNYDNAMARVVESLGPGETLGSRLNVMFGTNRFVQIFNPATGYRIYALFGSVSVTGTTATVQLNTPPAIPFKQNVPCGIVAPPSCGAGLLMSIVSRVKYEIMSLQGVSGSYASLVTAPPGVAAVTGDAGRTELVRTQLKPDGDPDDTTRQLVAEYAVDLRFGITKAEKIQNDNYNPTVTTYGFGDPNVYVIAGDVTAATAMPQLIRSVQVRLAARTRAPDRTADLPPGADGRRLHYLVGNGFVPPYARVRTVYANVGLPNQGGFSLW